MPLLFTQKPLLNNSLTIKHFIRVFAYLKRGPFERRLMVNGYSLVPPAGRFLANRKGPEEGQCPAHPLTHFKKDILNTNSTRM